MWGVKTCIGTVAISRKLNYELVVLKTYFFAWFWFSNLHEWESLDLYSFGADEKFQIVQLIQVSSSSIIIVSCIKICTESSDAVKRPRENNFKMHEVPSAGLLRRAEDKIVHRHRRQAMKNFSKLKLSLNRVAINVSEAVAGCKRWPQSKNIT